MLQSQRSFAIPEMWRASCCSASSGYLLNADLRARRAPRARVAPRREGERRELTRRPMLDDRATWARPTARATTPRTPSATCRSSSPSGRVRVRRRAVGLRQDDAAEVHVRPARAHGRRGRAARPAAWTARRRADGARLPGVQPLAAAVDVGARQRRAAAAAQEAREGRAGAARRGVRRRGRPRARARPLPVGALGRHAAARRHRTRRWPTSPRSCSWTSRSPRSTRRPAAISRT